MPDLPGGGFTVLFVCAAVIGVVVAFAIKELRFSFHRRRGIELFNEAKYQAALRHLIRAERLWMLRLSKQTMRSRAEDCKNLETVLKLIGQAALHCGLKIETEEYREAASKMEKFFSKTEVPSGEYPRVYSHFTELKKQFRLNLTNLAI